MLRRVESCGARRAEEEQVGGRLPEPRFSGRGDRGEQRGESGRGWERGREEAPRRVGRLLPVKYGLQLWEASVLAGAREGGRGEERGGPVRRRKSGNGGATAWWGRLSLYAWWGLLL